MINAYLEYIQERMFISNKTISIDLDKFINGDSNKLLIAGLSGGGKTTLCGHLSRKYNAQCFETDNCIHKMKHMYKQIGKYNPPENIMKEVFHEGYFTCVRPQLRTKKRQVAEGGFIWQSYLYFPEVRAEIDKFPIIIFGSSALKASWNVFQRVRKKKGYFRALSKISIIYERNFKLLNEKIDKFRNIRIQAGGNIEEFKVPKL